MKTKIIEATNGPRNWGKFLLATYDDEDMAYVSKIGKSPLLRSIGVSSDSVWILDIQTGEGARFYPSPDSNAKADLNKHQIWVCPLYEPFLQWFYQSWNGELDHLPAHIDLPDAPFSLRGYRRQPPHLWIKGVPPGLSELHIYCNSNPKRCVPLKPTGLGLFAEVAALDELCGHEHKGGP